MPDDAPDIPAGTTVELAHEATPELVQAFARLIPQLSSSNPAPTAEQVAELVAAKATDVLVARGPDGAITGTLTLCTFRIPTGIRSWIEDVVVDGEARGQGTGPALVHHALGVARGHGATTVDLTSRPSREAANRLYVRLGFAARETNVYRFTLR